MTTRVPLDDYFDYEGCQKAADQFLASHPEFAVQHRGENLIVRRAWPTATARPPDTRDPKQH